MLIRNELKKLNTMKTSDENLIATKSKAFAIRSINLYKYLTDNKKEFVMAELRAISSTIDYDIDWDVISTLIDTLCDMSKKVNI